MAIRIIVRDDIKLGTWQGMGGAFSEASAYNFAKLKPERQQALIDAYFGKDGLDYRWGRVSIGSNDFCLKPYEYSKRASLRDFSIKHDQQWVLPMLKQALQKQPLQLVASPWSPPKCFKILPKQRFGGLLKPWYYRRYAKYIHTWLDAYANEGVDFKYITPQNEPHAFQLWESCFYSYRNQRKLAYKYLAKELADTDVQILLWDHNKKKLTEVADQLFNGSFVGTYGANEKVAGLCFHWYNGIYPEQMWQVRQKYPDILMLSSEMCCGYSPYNRQEWKNDANLYYREIFADINSGTCAWIDWNMLLDWQGGPSYCKNYVKSPVILNETGDDFILTPIYTALQKFANMFPVGSQIIRCDFDSNDIVAIARKTETDYEAVVANVSDRDQEIKLRLEPNSKQLTLGRYEIRKISMKKMTTKMVVPAGLEPATRGSSGRCSTN